jgi:hypothetical protein
MGWATFWAVFSQTNLVTLNATNPKMIGSNVVSTEFINVGQSMSALGSI